MMKKRYYAYVTKNMIGYFEAMLQKRADKIKVIRVASVVSYDGRPLLYYELEAEEGIINSKWELKTKKAPSN